MTVSVGKKAPNFKATALVDNEFKTLSLDDYKGKYLVLFFYPLDFTFVCPTEIIAFSDRFPEFQALQTSVVGVSVDSEYAHLAWTNQPRKEGGLGAMKIPLLSDLTKKIALDYGVLNDDGVAFRGTFIIDPEQNVRVAMINDLPIGRSVDEVLRLVEAVQFNEKYGEVCPAGWTKGADTIDTKDAKKYFSKFTPHHEKRTLAEKAVKLNKREVVKRDAENPQTFLPGPPPLPPLAPKLENPCANANRLHPQCDF
ncbi:Peroxiredoxin-2 [Clydaea vesicula]|uniref:thioredoxin-dependent peroxiredoxin n=1 Tax=Clydaea vesicula TaxID=447962 RepID=A0AAD5TZ60_9FUNG|nr:Peroxiredoxin-2 [Clydaea vesicula]